MAKFAALFEKYDRLVLFDTETTGLLYNRDEIIEFAAVVVEPVNGVPTVVREYDELVSLSPGGFVPPKIEQLTGISTQDIRERGLPLPDGHPGTPSAPAHPVSARSAQPDCAPCGQRHPFRFPGASAARQTDPRFPAHSMSLPPRPPADSRAWLGFWSHFPSRHTARGQAASRKAAVPSPEAPAVPYDRALQ